MKREKKILHISSRGKGRRSSPPLTPGGKGPDKVRRARARNLLLGGGLFLILCWTIGSVLLIGERLQGRNGAEVISRQVIISALYQPERTNSP